MRGSFRGPVGLVDFVNFVSGISAACACAGVSPWRPPTNYRFERVPVRWQDQPSRMS